MIAGDIKSFWKNVQINKPILSIDYGLKKVGFGISNPQFTISLPLKMEILVGDQQKITAILKLITEKEISGLVIGMPFNTNGTVGEQANEVMRFANLLATKIDIPIFMQDERFSSKTADNMLKTFGMKRKERNNKDDAVSASLILESVLSSRNYI
jgi:putative Holliday junction resolvase